MRISRIAVYRTDLPYVGGTYTWGPGRVFEVGDTTVVTIETDTGVYGCGECCPMEGNYAEAYPEGVRSAAARLARALLGQDPRQIGRVERMMDEALKGHGYAKSAFDAACWDILGKSTGLPVYMLLGGKLSAHAPMYRVVPQAAPDAMAGEMQKYREAGYRVFQIKVGSDPDGDIERIRATVPHLKPGERAFVDANTGWRMDEAVRVVRAVQDLDFYVEQPCLTYEECLHVRRSTSHPMKLDECVGNIRMVERMIADRAAEVLSIKVSREGGLTKSRRIRDLCVEHGIALVIEDVWGGEIVTAAHAHLAVSTPQELLMSSTDLHNYTTVSTGCPGPAVESGNLFAPEAPGLGVEPRFDILGEPVHIYE